MPGRRLEKKGSFGGHLEELVRVFELQQSRKMERPEKRTSKGDGDNVHDRLFKSAWRAAREKGQGPKL